MLQTLKDNRLYAKLSKCEFWLEEVSFLGHVISRRRIVVDPSKVKAMMSWESPKLMFEIRSFLGLACYYHKLIEGFSKLAFVVYCDASKMGLGGMLMQGDQVVSYASRKLKIHERNYPTHDLELVIIVFALKIWRHYVYVSKFEVFSDYKSLRYLFDQINFNMR